MFSYLHNFESTVYSIIWTINYKVKTIKILIKDEIVFYYWALKHLQQLLTDCTW